MAKGGLSKLANLSITLQRRWSNVLSDQQRQHIVEMFLGLRTDTYFPSARLLYSPDLPLEARLSQAWITRVVCCSVVVTSIAATKVSTFILSPSTFLGIPSLSRCLAP